MDDLMLLHARAALLKNRFLGSAPRQFIGQHLIKQAVPADFDRAIRASLDGPPYALPLHPPMQETPASERGLMHMAGREVEDTPIKSQPYRQSMMDRIREWQSRMGYKHPKLMKWTGRAALPAAIAGTAGLGYLGYRALSGDSAPQEAQEELAPTPVTPGADNTVRNRIRGLASRLASTGVGRAFQNFHRAWWGGNKERTP